MIYREGDEYDLWMVYQRVKPRLTVTYKEFKVSTEAFSLVRIIDGDLLAIAMVRGDEGHIISYPNKHVGITRIREAMNYLGIKKTSVMTDYKAGNVLAKRLGFTKTHELKGITFYEQIS